MKIPKKPRVGQNVIQSFNTSLNQIIDYLPSLTVRNDLGGTSMSQSPNGALVHRKNISLYPNIYNISDTMRPEIFGHGLKQRIFAEFITGAAVDWLTVPTLVSLNLRGDNEYIKAQLTIEDPTGDYIEDFQKTYMEVKWIGPELVAPPSTGNYVLSSSNGNVSWQPNSGGSGSGTTVICGCLWPYWDNLAGSGNIVLTKTDYVAGPSGGWLRISQKGSNYDCNSVYINGNHIGLYPGGQGNTWVLPIPPNNTFYIEFPADVTRCWFDNDCSPHKCNEDDIDYWNDHYYGSNMQQYVTSAQEELDSASANFRDAKEAADAAEYDWTQYGYDPEELEPEEQYASWVNTAQLATNVISADLGVVQNLLESAEAENASLQAQGHYGGDQYVQKIERIVIKIEQYLTDAQAQVARAQHYKDLAYPPQPTE